MGYEYLTFNSGFMPGYGQGIGLNYPQTFMPNYQQAVMSKPSVFDYGFWGLALGNTPTLSNWQIPNPFGQFKLPQLIFPRFDFSQFKTPQLNFLNLNPTPSTQSTTQSQENKSKKTENNTTLTSGTKNLAYWKSQGYDGKMGAKLAKDAVARCPYVWNGQCVGYTRETINKVYGTKFKKAGQGQNFGHYILDSKELKGKFKCFKINGIKPSEIPDGAVLIWPGTAFKSGKARLYGHGAIAYNGKPYSDNVGCDTMKCNEIWIPVASA